MKMIHEKIFKYRLCTPIHANVFRKKTPFDIDLHFDHERRIDNHFFCNCCEFKIIFSRTKKSENVIVMLCDCCYDTKDFIVSLSFQQK